MEMLEGFSVESKYGAYRVIFKKFRTGDCWENGFHKKNIIRGRIHGFFKEYYEKILDFDSSTPDR